VRKDNGYFSLELKKGNNLAPKAKKVKSKIKVKIKEEVDQVSESTCQF
jgi:hypothetical protein